VIEDYPSHLQRAQSAETRWLRGIGKCWMAAASRAGGVGDRVPNPISLISWWKIFDNCAAAWWNPPLSCCSSSAVHARPPVMAVDSSHNCILFIPAWFQLVFNLVRALVRFNSTAPAKR